MQSLPSSQAIVAENVVLDGRLALFHKRKSWLALSDFHFRYELSQPAAGNLFPVWRMRSSETRLQELLRDYNPA
jgi:metallophosphoesterase superfamily enzyme